MRPDDYDNSSNSLSRGKLAFLGPEFLTWLYFYINEEGAELKLSELLGDDTIRDIAKVAIGKRMTLKPLAQDDRQVSITSPMLDDAGEVFQSIRHGGHIYVLSLDMAIGERFYSFTLNAGDAAITGVKMKLMFKAKGENEYDDQISEKEMQDRDKIATEETILLRMSVLDEIDNIVDGLFRKFLSRRLAQAFVAEDMAQMRANVKERLSQFAVT